MARKQTEKIHSEIQDRFDEMSDYISDVTDDCRRLEVERKYLLDFILYKDLEDEYYYFRQHAHEEIIPDLPFSKYVL